MRMIRTMMTLINMMPSVEPICEVCSTGEVAVTLTAKAALALRLDAVKTGWLSAALTIASNKPIPVNAD